MKVIGSKTSFQNHQPSKIHFVSGADEKRKFFRPAVTDKDTDTVTVKDTDTVTDKESEW